MQIELTPEMTAIDVLRGAQQTLLSIHGPCCTSCESLLQATAIRIVKDSSLKEDVRTRILEEIDSLLSTGTTRQLSSCS